MTPKVGDLSVVTEIVRTVTPPGPDWEWVGWFVVLPILIAITYSFDHYGVIQ